MSAHEAGRELDAIVAERVMRESLTVPRERALAMVGEGFVSATGRPFKLNVFGSRLEVNVPDGESLGGHPSDDDWNQRYYRYIAEYLLRDPEFGPPVEQRVQQAMRAPAKHYSTDIAAAWTVVEKHGLGDWNWRVSQTDAGNWFAEVRLGYESSYSAAFPAWAETAPLAICRAALAAIGTEMPA